MDSICPGRPSLSSLSVLHLPARLLHAPLFSGSLDPPSLIQLSLTAERSFMPATSSRCKLSVVFGDTMAGTTMSALTNCGLQRGAVHHSLVTSSFKANDVSTCSSVSFPAVHCSWEGRDSRETVSTSETLRNAACGLCLSLTLATALPSFAAQSSQVRLPPLSNDPDRCVRAFVGNTIGQANGVADKVLDLRMCDFSNDVTNLKGKTLSSALMSDAKFDGADLTEVVMSKAYAVGASFKGANFRNAVVDRVAFDKSDMQGVQFINTVLSGSTFDGANLEGASFENALIGYVDIQKLCRNPTLPEESRIDLACKP